MNLSSESLIEIKPSPIHGLGAFATRPIPPETRLLEYLGAKITKAESLRRCELNNPFIFALDDEFDLDGAVGWNPARFINHSCTPNCEAQCIDGHIWIISKHPIQTGQEITFNYGYDLDEYRQHPCHCGSPQCVGFVLAEEFHSLLLSPIPQHQHPLTTQFETPRPALTRDTAPICNSQGD